MKQSNYLIFLLAIAIALSQLSCAKIGKTISNQGTGEITDIGSGQYDILASGGFSGNRGETYAKWDRTAKLACNGGEYKTIKREWQSAEYPGLLGGIIECTKANNNQTNQVSTKTEEKKVSFSKRKFKSKSKRHIRR